MSWFKPRNPKPKPEEPKEESPKPEPAKYNEKLLNDVLTTLDEETGKLNKQRLELEIVLRRGQNEIGRQRIKLEFDL